MKMSQNSTMLKLKLRETKLRLLRNDFAVPVERDVLVSMADTLQTLILAVKESAIIENEGKERAAPGRRVFSGQYPQFTPQR
jgi:hypothetical protein